MASQLDSAKTVEIKKKIVPNASEGQYLPGGSTQLVIDFYHEANQHAQKAAKALPRKRTFWKNDDLEGLHVPEKAVEAQILAAPEIKTK